MSLEWKSDCHKEDLPKRNSTAQHMRTAPLRYMLEGGSNSGSGWNADEANESLSDGSSSSGSSS